MFNGQTQSAQQQAAELTLQIENVVTAAKTNKNGAIDYDSLFTQLSQFEKELGKLHQYKELMKMKHSRDTADFAETVEKHIQDLQQIFVGISGLDQRKFGILGEQLNFEVPAMNAWLEARAPADSLGQAADGVFAGRGT